MKKSNLRYILVLISMCGLIASSVGLTTNIAGLFFTPVAEEFGILKGSVSLTLTICNIVFAIGGLIAPKLLNEKSIKKLIMIGTLTIVLSTAGLGITNDIILMYVLNAIRGFAGGLLGFVLVTMVINNWFVASVGLATSIAMSCSGLSGALFSPIISNVIESAGWRTGYFVVAILMLVLNLPAILFLPSLTPEAKGLDPYGGHAKVKPSSSSDQEAAQPISKMLMVLVFLFACMACAATALPQHFPGISGSYAMAESVGAMMLSVCMVANSLGKIIFGAMADRLGARVSIMIYSALAMASVIIMWLIHIPAMMTIGACFYGLVYTLGTVAVVMVTKDMFGLANYGQTYPIFSLGGTLANAVFSSVIGFIYDFSQSYVPTLLLMLAMLGVNVIIIIVSYAKKA